MFSRRGDLEHFRLRLISALVLFKKSDDARHGLATGSRVIIAEPGSGADSREELSGFIGGIRENCLPMEPWGDLIESIVRTESERFYGLDHILWSNCDLGFGRNEFVPYCWVDFIWG